MKTKSYYEILGVSDNATADEIRKAFRKKSLLYHPDKHMDNPLRDLALEKQKDLNEAYETLSDPIKKQAYDQEIHGEPIVDRQPEWKESSRTQQDKDKAKRDEQYKREKQSQIIGLIIGLIGIVLIIMGLFIPLFKISRFTDFSFEGKQFKGGISFFESNKTGSIIVMGLLAISLILILAKRNSSLFFSIATLAVVLRTGVQTSRRLLSISYYEASTGYGYGLSNGWGLAFLIVGAILLILCSAISRTKKVGSR